MLESAGSLDLLAVFWDAPLSYCLLATLSVTATVIWAYSLLTVHRSRLMPKTLMQNLRELIDSKRFEGALEACRQQGGVAASIIASGLAARGHGSQVMMEAVQAEGRRAGTSLWQRVSLLNDIAVIAPMIGLLGTVLGMFCAFYDSGHAAESLQSIFDGLGIAIGTTVGGLLVAITAMIYYTTLRLRVVSLMNAIENEAVSLLNQVRVD